MPSTPSQKSIDVCRSAPTMVMWWTPWLWSLRMEDLYRLDGMLQWGHDDRRRAAGHERAVRRGGARGDGPRLGRLARGARRGRGGRARPSRPRAPPGADAPRARLELVAADHRRGL